MKLAIPIFKDDKIYDNVDIQKPKTGTITRVYEIAQKGNVFHAMLEFISLCIISVTSTDGDIIDDKMSIKKICGSMPYISVEAISIKVIAMINEDDYVEGVYSCPRCGHKIVTEYDDLIGIDTRDKISDLEVNCMDNEEYNNVILVNLNESVKIKNKKTGEMIQEIEEFEIRYPTLNDCIVAGQNMVNGQEVRIQLKIYVNSLISVNGKFVDKKWISMWGGMLMRNTDPRDLSQIGRALQMYGLKKTTERICNNCGKVWEAIINTSNFFVSGLQPT